MTRRLKYLLLVMTTFLWLINHAQVTPGYYANTQGLDGEELKLALHETIRVHTRRSYNALWTDLFRTDQKLNGNVWDIYSDFPSPGTPPYEFVFFTNQCPGGIEPEGSLCGARLRILIGLLQV